MKSVSLCLAFALSLLLSFTVSRAADVTPAFKEQVRRLLKDYVEVKTALVDAQTREAKSSAGRMLKTIEDFNAKALTPEEKAYYDTHSTALSAAIQNLVSTEEVGKQRDHFKEVSESMVELVKGNNYEAGTTPAPAVAASSAAPDAAGKNASARNVSGKPAKGGMFGMKKSKPGDLLFEDEKSKFCLFYCPITKGYWIADENDGGHPYLGKRFTEEEVKTMREKYRKEQ